MVYIYTCFWEYRYAKSKYINELAAILDDKTSIKPIKLYIMNRLFITLTLIFLMINHIGLAHDKDSTIRNNLEYKFEQLENQLKEVRRDELNYQIEKNLLKETYSNNFEKISLIITLTLGVIGVLSFLGIKDINSIKKEYTSELAKLKQLQIDVTNKFQEFQINKEKYDTELRDILKTNEEQNKKIKVLELKEKIANLFKEAQYVSALEYCIVALELSPDDISLLDSKAKVYTRNRNYKDSISTYNKMLELSKDNESAIFDLSEVLLFNRQRKEHEELIEKHKSLFVEKINGKLLKIFSIVKAYQEKNIEELTKLSLDNIDLSDIQSKRRRIDEWDFKDILLYLALEPVSNERTITQSIFWYLDGQIDAADFSNRTSIQLQRP